MTCIQQYKFIRLDKHANYEPLIMCLKGLQLEYNPGEYLTAEQMAASPRLARGYRELKEWSLRPDADRRTNDRAVPEYGPSRADERTASSARPTSSTTSTTRSARSRAS